MRCQMPIDGGRGPGQPGTKPAWQRAGKQQAQPPKSRLIKLGWRRRADARLLAHRTLISAVPDKKSPPDRQQKDRKQHVAGDSNGTNAAEAGHARVARQSKRPETCNSGATAQQKGPT